MTDKWPGRRWLPAHLTEHDLAFDGGERPVAASAGQRVCRAQLQDQENPQVRRVDQW